MVERICQTQKTDAGEIVSGKLSEQSWYSLRWSSPDIFFMVVYPCTGTALVLLQNIDGTVSKNWCQYEIIRPKLLMKIKVVLGGRAHS